MTGYGFTGPMTARGTTFSNKDPGVTAITGSRYRYGYRYGWVGVLALIVGQLWLLRIVTTPSR